MEYWLSLLINKCVAFLYRRAASAIAGTRYQGRHRRGARLGTVGQMHFLTIKFGIQDAHNKPKHNELKIENLC